MSVILDLSVFDTETADIRFGDGTVLHLKKPTQRMVIHMLAMKDIDESKPPLEIVAALDRMCIEILNNNTEGVAFDAKSVAALDPDKKTAILREYSAWATQLQANPTLPRPESPDGKERHPWKWLRRCIPWRNTRG